MRANMAVMPSVVLVDRDPVHIPLSITKEHVQELSSKLGTLTALVKSMNVTRDLAMILRELWDEVVSPIVGFLQTINLSRITDLVVSYRRVLSPSSPRCWATKLANIGQRIDGLATFTRIEGHESCVARVTEELKKNDWVHLACHGLANGKQPFESAFALSDGHFTIERIIRCELENPQFAYLSACHTTVGDEESPDEVIHLASAMQFAGFRSVIGTMWAVDDGETNKITSVFYDCMKDEYGHLDHTRAAFALNETMKVAEIPFDQRISYIHLGA
ncbi:hypothetical protein J3R83DRAFT_3699 [Lanmaoa asiatica]|nr:hypothetical protein J3R83DRAFT_3699 [Lanmaoa asiatica]